MSNAATQSDNYLNDWHHQAITLQNNINQTILGQENIIELMVLAIFCRGHILLEGDVGVGKTTLLRAAAESLGGDFERIEGTIDLMPHDLVYYTHIASDGKPAVSEGPLLKHGEDLSIFFFNEINRARPQVHSLLLRVMAERSVSAFNKTFHFPHLQVFADRNRIEKDETFELPAAARDRFMMELHIKQPRAEAQLKELMFNTRYYDADKLVDSADKAVLPFNQLNDIAVMIQAQIHTSGAIQDYGYHLCQALRRPQDYDIKISDTDSSKLVLGGMGPRGISYLARSARAHAWLKQRNNVIPEDFHAVIRAISKHRIFINPVYNYNGEAIIEELISSVLNTIPSP
ncbi:MULTISPECIES: MoxR family ATPase [Gammaproteobacteria]|jgi:MoxR-like ATPase|uniref:AAA family ATPase n=1 Tax=Gammaproteobacteria TaxID=1236 RepID=UPI000C9011DD|nr:MULTISPECIES: MoxR family ATPase [Gammaproteobacteria]MAK66230.1 AAA family ATPase [Methylophaga sp.]MAY17425.1 AAA family ATPase [Methylophaga sp.]MBN47367.1 AAA family ATPase [Methylophaga sp.]HAO26046.1 AAA family ATPase [Methylophaga sp.]HCD03916.1 AAA family ATPase [Methylophaga sp.]|tara:strand:+ start:3827 stop:4861 length:1035 start_codon:yes stop_codon:yes gene_type:complete